MRALYIPLVAASIATGVCGGDPTDTATDTADSACLEVPWYVDADGDGWGFQDPGFPPTSVWACNQPSGYSPHASDCDDTDPTVNPGATEVPSNGVDENCDGADL